MNVVSHTAGMEYSDSGESRVDMDMGGIFLLFVPDSYDGSGARGLILKGGVGIQLSTEFTLALKLASPKCITIIPTRPSRISCI
jgi:hypothetical protein